MEFEGETKMEIKIMSGKEIEQRYKDFSFEDDEEMREKTFLVDFENKIIYIASCEYGASTIYDYDREYTGFRVAEDSYMMDIFDCEIELLKPKEIKNICATCGREHFLEFKPDPKNKYNCTKCSMESLRKSERYEMGCNDGESRFSEKKIKDSTESFSGII